MPGRVYTAVWACKRATVSYHGAYPADFLPRLYRFLELKDERICHLYAGTVQKTLHDEVRVDLNPRTRPDLLQDARYTTLAGASFDRVFADPPYDEENAKYYDLPYPGVKAVVMECSRLTKPGGLYGVMHWILPVNYAGDLRTAVIAITEGANMRGRFFTLFTKI